MVTPEVVTHWAHPPKHKHPTHNCSHALIHPTYSMAWSVVKSSTMKVKLWPYHVIREAFFASILRVRCKRKQHPRQSAGEEKIKSNFPVHMATSYILYCSVVVVK